MDIRLQIFYHRHCNDWNNSWIISNVLCFLDLVSIVPSKVQWKTHNTIEFLSPKVCYNSFHIEMHIIYIYIYIYIYTIYLYYILILYTIYYIYIYISYILIYVNIYIYIHINIYITKTGIWHIIYIQDKTGSFTPHLNKRSALFTWKHEITVSHMYYSWIFY